MTKTNLQNVTLIADIGGTHVRFALVLPDDTIVETQILTANTMPDAVTDCLSACRFYLDRLPPNRYRVTRALWAVAGLYIDDRVTIATRGWSFVRAEIQAAFGWDEFEIVNDFAAQALALPQLTAADKILIKPGQSDVTAPLAVIGPGTGLGVAGLIPLGDGAWHVLPGEGGHVTLSATDDTEDKIVARLRDRCGYVSAETILSGRGLVHLAQAMDPHAPSHTPWQTPHALVAAAKAASPDPQAVAVLDRFCALLGTFAGDVALTQGARGGVYLTGGVLPAIIETLRHSAFAARFTDRPVVKAYLDAIPVWLVIHPLPAFLGLQFLLKTKRLVKTG